MGGLMAKEMLVAANVETKSSMADVPFRGKETSFVFDDDSGEKLVAWLKEHEEIKNIEEQINKKTPVMIVGAGDSQKALITALIENDNRPILLIVPDNKSVIRWTQDLHFFLPTKEIMTCPVVEESDFKVTFSGQERLRDRMHTLSALIQNKPVIVLMTAVEVAQCMIGKKEMGEQSISFHMSDDIDREKLLHQLVDMGYERVSQVERSGHFSVRGDIIDIFAINEEHPVRMEFFGDTIDSLRLFDEDTQRSIENIQQFLLFPIHVKGDLETIFSYFSQGILIYDEPQQSEEELKKYMHEDVENSDKVISWKEIVSLGHKIGENEIIYSLLKRKVEGFPDLTYESWKGRSIVNYQRQISLFMNDLSDLLKDGWAAVLYTPRLSEHRELSEYIDEYHIPLGRDIRPGKIILQNQLLSQGFELPESKVIVIAAGDVLGKQKVMKYKAGAKGKQIRYFSDLHIGDYVVQNVHGIGKYIGLNTIELEGIHRDYVTIQYAGSDKLYLPMEQIATLEKYIGPEGQTPALHHMGGTQWDKVRNKAKASIEELAEKLLDVYANREISEGIAFLPDTEEQRAFEETFPYVETDDQLEAINTVKRLMERPMPMDMLVCGDVGFGKTEVAMRAVFKCVMSGYQAIVLCPTTVLSKQHHKTFSDRMGAFGVNVVLLNRFTTAKEKKEILAKAATGEVDVIIGTHAVLSKQIPCKKLGLLVVDEEQRFGVMQKEKWKSWSKGLDVLTLSATPIPRTLHMSLSGVRDMVTMMQPPTNRHAIQTYVTEYDDIIVKDAIMREKARGGQTYFIYNRIESIAAMETHLRKILPKDVTIAVAYGRMEGKKLERIMMEFFEGAYDVLLCTTLVENGVDQPNANTLLVYDADKLGLSQIYQMRGRVGRSERIAKAWFFYRRGKILSDVAEKRLTTIREFTELGSGFKIAMRDLEIRGAGNLLGSAQHGNIAGVGFATYCNMLEDAVSCLRAKREHREIPEKLPAATVELRQDAYLDSDYIADEESKMEIYRRLAVVGTEEELRDLLDEVIDRFGTPTSPVEKLFAGARIRIRAQRLGIGSIIDERETILISWINERPMQHWNLNLLPAYFMDKLHFLPGVPARVRIKKADISGSLIKWISELLEEITKEIN